MVSDLFPPFSHSPPFSFHGPSPPILSEGVRVITGCCRAKTYLDIHFASAGCFSTLLNATRLSQVLSPACGSLLRLYSLSVMSWLRLSLHALDQQLTTGCTRRLASGLQSTGPCWASRDSLPMQKQNATPLLSKPNQQIDTACNGRGKESRMGV
jgi:hypothetical protein